MPGARSESWSVQGGEPQAAAELALACSTSSSESAFSLECRAHLAHVGIFSDDSNFFSARDNICVSKLFYLPSLPLSSTTQSHTSGASCASVRGRHLGRSCLWPLSALCLSHRLPSGASWANWTNYTLLHPMWSPHLNPSGTNVGRWL